MKSRTAAGFRRQLGSLPDEVRLRARTAFQRFKNDPRHPGLYFKKIHVGLPLFSVRISRGYRAVGRLDDGVMIWFFIGSHADYDALLRQM